MADSNIRFMAEALQLARHGLYSTHPNPRVGCLILKRDIVIGRGFHLQRGQAHAEQMALQEAGAAAQGATVYVNLEPCAHQGHTESCAAALVKAGVRKVYAATLDPNPLVAGKGLTMLRQAGIEVETGILEGAARDLNIGFMHRFERGRPWVRCKLAASLDGATAIPNYDNQAKQDKWITSENARQDVHRWRARSAAIVSSAASVSADNARLNARPDLAGAQEEKALTQPLRVLLDSRFRLTPDAAFFQAQGPKLWIGAEGAKPPPKAPAETEIMRLPTNTAEKLRLSALMEELTRREINELLVEAGAELAASFLNAELVDELILYVAPRLLGTGAPPLIKTKFMAKKEEVQFEWKDVRFFGQDLRLVLQPLQRKSK